MPVHDISPSDTANVTGTPNVYGASTIGTEQQNLATYDPALKKIRGMTPGERQRGAFRTRDGKLDPEAQLKSLQDAATQQRQDQVGQSPGFYDDPVVGRAPSPFAGLGRRVRR